MSEAGRYRLPRTVVPRAYRLELAPDLSAATFAGTVEIDVEAAEPVEEIVLNAADLSFRGVRLESGGKEIAANPTFDGETERCHLALASRLPAGPATLRIEFDGVLNDRLVGFYKSSFRDAEGNEHLIATTQMEAPHARRAFPCWDEPDFKATFAITLVVPAELAAFSNGAEISSDDLGDGRRRVRFAPTMKMSTYLVALIVGPLHATDPVDVDGTPLRVAHPPGKGHLTAYALECGAFALRFFAGYYGIDYPAGKLDLVAIPDFTFGAMENLGCVTFRETALLTDPARATQPELQRVADVIHHEIAHMWFGDLVTMRWWNGIWLNEAFATFMEMKCTDAFRPEWKRWVDFGISRGAAFDVDALESTRPVEFEVVSPDDAEGMFDVLTYEKGAAVLLMLEQYLGPDEFMDGVRKYLNDHAYGNTETTDLWDAIEEATGQPVRQIMDTWIFQGGYPILSAGLSGSTLHLTQRRFRYWGDDLGESWLVPVIVSYGSGTETGSARMLLGDRQGELELDLEPEWVVVNAGAAGFYRVSYAPGMFEGLQKAGLSPLERYQLLDDAWAAVLAGMSSAADFLRLAGTFAGEDDLSVWQRLVGCLGSLNRIVEPQARPAFEQAVQRLVAPALGRLGPEPGEAEDERTGQLRATLFEAMAILGGSAATRSLAESLHASYLDNPDGVDPALAAAALRVIAEFGGAAELDLLWSRYLELDNPQLKIRYLHALAQLRSPALMERVLDLAMTEVRSQDAPLLIQRAMANRERGAQVWRYVADHWEEISARFPANLVVRLTGGITTFTDALVATEVEQFFADHPLKQGAKTLAQHLEKMRVNVSLYERESASFSSSLG